MAKKKQFENRKHNFLIFRCTDTEKVQTLQAAKEYKMTVSDYIRKILGFKEE